MGESDLKQFMQLRSHLIFETENAVWEPNLCPVQIPTMSKNMDKELKQAHRVVDVVDRPNKKICVTLLHYIVDKPENWYFQFRLNATKKEEEKFQQIVSVNNFFKEFLSILGATISLYDEVINPFKNS